MRRLTLLGFLLALTAISPAKATWVDAATMGFLARACTALGQQDCTGPATPISVPAAKRSLTDALNRWCFFKRSPHGRYGRQPCNGQPEGIENLINSAKQQLSSGQAAQALPDTIAAHGAAETGPPPYRVVYGYARCLKQHPNDPAFCSSFHRTADEPLPVAEPQAVPFDLMHVFGATDPTTLSNLSGACEALALTKSCTIPVPPAHGNPVAVGTALQKLESAEISWCAFRNVAHPPYAADPCLGAPSAPETKPELVLFLMQLAHDDLSAPNLTRAQKDAMLAYSAAETGPPPYIKPRDLELLLQQLQGCIERYGVDKCFQINPH